MSQGRDSTIARAVTEGPRAVLGGSGVRGRPAARTARDAVGGRELQQLLQVGADLRLGQGPLEQRERSTTDHREHAGDGLHLERLGDGRVGVDVDLGQHPAPGVLVSQALEDR